MKGFLISLSIALPVSVFVTVVLFLAATVLGGTCHCIRPNAVLFPYSTFIMRTDWENTWLITTFLQFPLYAIVIAVGGTWRRRLLVSAAILFVHSITAAAALNFVGR